MKKRMLSTYQFVSKVLAIYAITILIVATIARICGDEVAIYSSLYQLGSKGLAYETLLQLFVSSLVITAINTFFFSKKHFKNQMMIWKIVGMMITILAVMIAFIYIFKWLPFGSSTVALLAWGCFLVAFLGCFGSGILLSVIKMKLEEKKYDELLQGYKNRHSKEACDE